MPLSMSQASVPMFVQLLEAMSKTLDKADAYATAKKIDPVVMGSLRLAPDMFPLTRQVQIACDFAKGAAARLAGIDLPTYEDNERTIAELKTRIAKTIAFVKSIDAAKIDGSEARDVTIKMRGNPVTFKGQPYLINFAIPNFVFHVTATYAILRANGVDIGKGDFMGAVPGLTV